MGIFDKVKKTTIASRQREELFYEMALREVENNEIRKGLYAKALAKAEGDKEKADGIYLKLRVQSIMDSIESEQFDRIEEKDLYDECNEMLGNKGYELRHSKSGKYYVGPSKNPFFSSNDLIKIKNWASASTGVWAGKQGKY